MKTYSSVNELIGNTPLLELKNLKKSLKLKANIFAKLEFFNPAGSVKDRVAKFMIDDAEKDGRLKPNSVIIEPTSGNTGIGLAAVAAAKGYKTIIVMPDTMSIERRKLLKAYGAELVLTDGALGMQGAINEAEKLASSLNDAIIMGQFTNPSNPKAHFVTTGKEIYEDLDGNVDCFIAGVGTGGTITGVGTYLKGVKNDVKIVAVEPLSSPVLTTGKAGKHEIQGIGAGFVPKILNTDVYDEVIAVSNENAYTFAHLLGKCEGVLVGISSGASLCAAVELANRPEYENKNLVVLFPDGGDRYLSTKLFAE